MPSFSNDVIVITGGSGGMGEAMARRLLADGARVALFDLSEEALEAAVGRLGGDPARVIGVVGNTAESESMDSAVAQVVEAFGSVSGLITAAGIRQTAALFHEIDLSQWNLLHQVNVMGTMIAIRACREQLIANRGSVVTVASVTAGGARWAQSAYAVSKASVSHLTKQIALELSPHRVRVNCLCPGVTNTPMIAQATKTDGPGVLEAKVNGSLEQFRPGIPLGRLAEPEEQAAAAAFLLSSDASFITGIDLYVDGGVSMIG
jgi:NAD(P)-dependent dehydrogenase (short-subunit alcohol dehydrogenase family)